MFKKNKITILGSIFFIIVLFHNGVYAASANLSASTTNASIGEKITITTTINGASWQVSLSEDNGEVSTTYADNTDDAEDTTLKKTLTFTPKKAGTYTVKLSGNVTGANDSKSTTVSDTVTIKVESPKVEENSTNNNTNNNTENNTTESNKESKDNSTEKEKKEESSNNNQTNQAESTDKKEENNNQPAQKVEQKKSSNANLSNLGIRPNDFTGFKSGTTSYNVTVPYDVEKVEVYAKVQDSKANVSGTGNKPLDVGKNSLNVVVTAEDGTKKTYTINVTRQEEKKNETNTTNEVSNNTTNQNTTNEISNTSNTANNATTNTTSNGDITKLEVVGYNLSPVFSSNIYEYKLTVEEDVDKLDIKAQTSNNGVQFEIAGNSDLKMGENVITVVSHNKYTDENTTYQIIVTKVAKENPHAEAILEAKQKRNLIIKLGIAFIIVLIILCIIVFKKSKDEENDYEEKKEIKVEQKPHRNKEELTHKNNNVKENMSEQPTQRITIDRDEAFDEKLQKIKNKQRQQEKGGKHF